MSSLKKNLKLQTLYQVLSVGMPLITSPYLARKLGPEQLGIFSYTTSVVLYFSLFAMLGTVNYGTRSIAAVRHDKKNINNTFSSIYAFQVITSIIALVAYIIYLCLFCKENQFIAALQGITILGCITDINWLYWGLEKFDITIKRNIGIKILTVMAILLFVKQQSDLWIYTLIMLGGTLISNLVLFVYLPQNAKFTELNVNLIKTHIKPNIALFIPIFAMSVYHIMDKTMLGVLSNFKESGYYYNSDKVVQIPIAVISGVATVLLPRITNLVSEGNKDKADKLFITTLDGIGAISVAMACGISAIAKEFVPLFFGKGYEACIALIVVFAPILVIKGLSTLIRVEYLVPMKKEKSITKSVVAGAGVNFIFNILLIRSYGAIGAVIATVAAELVACIIQVIAIAKEGLKIKIIFERLIVYIIFGFVMIACVRSVAGLDVNSLLKVILEVLAGGAVYIGGCSMFWIITHNDVMKIFAKKY